MHLSHAMFSPMEGKGEKVERKQGGRDIDFFPPSSLSLSMISSAARTQKICEGMTVLNVLFTDGEKKGNREETSVPKRQKARLFSWHSICVSPADT